MCVCECMLCRIIPIYAQRSVLEVILLPSLALARDLTRRGWGPTKKADFAQAGQDHAKYAISFVIWDGKKFYMSEDDKKVKYEVIPPPVSSNYTYFVLCLYSLIQSFISSICNMFLYITYCTICYITYVTSMGWSIVLYII